MQESIVLDVDEDIVSVPVQETVVYVVVQENYCSIYVDEDIVSVPVQEVCGLCPSARGCYNCSESHTSKVRERPKQRVPSSIN